MPDRVSWLAIRPGWKVLAVDGSQIGEVDEVVGDENEDIFDGISIAVTALGQPRYVDSDRIAAIEQGVVTLSVDHDAAAALAQYREPATSLEIEPDDRRGVGEAIASEFREKIEGALVEPPRRERSLSLIARIAHWLRRLRG
jgi:hypothetical protein